MAPPFAAVKINCRSKAHEPGGGGLPPKRMSFGGRCREVLVILAKLVCLHGQIILERPVAWQSLNLAAAALHLAAAFVPRLTPGALARRSISSFLKSGFW